MAKQELSCTLKNLMFMQRAAQRDERIEKQEEEVKPDGNFFSPGIINKCVVIMEGDPDPGAVFGWMSFQSSIPSAGARMKKLNEQQQMKLLMHVPLLPAVSGRSLRENESSADGVECSSTAKPSSEVNGDH